MLSAGIVVPRVLILSAGIIVSRVLILSAGIVVLRVSIPSAGIIVSRVWILSTSILVSKVSIFSANFLYIEWGGALWNQIFLKAHVSDDWIEDDHLDRSILYVSPLCTRSIVTTA